MSYVDAHIHLADAGYAGKVDQVIAEATQHNVAHMLTNATNFESSLETIKLARQFPQRVLAAIGVHPSTVVQSEDLHLTEFGEMIEENAEWVTAVGEIGLDGKYSQDERIKERQREVFRFFLKLAEEKNLPVVVHSRQAVQETLDTLADFHIPKVLLHWYEGPIENLDAIKERGFFISIGPALLYSRRIEAIARTADAKTILSETDGPVFYRGLFHGQLTQPWFVVEVVQKLTELKNLSTEQLRSMIFANFLNFIHP